MSIVYISMLYIVLLFVRAPFYVVLVFICICSVFKLFRLSSSLAKQLARKTPLRKLWRGDHLHKAQAEECLIVLVYCILSLFNCMIFLYCPLARRDILLTSMARYSLFVLKVPLNTKQTKLLVKDACCRVSYFFLLKPRVVQYSGTILA